MVGDMVIHRMKDGSMFIGRKDSEALRLLMQPWPSPEEQQAAEEQQRREAAENERQRKIGEMYARRFAPGLGAAEQLDASPVSLLPPRSAASTLPDVGPPSRYNAASPVSPGAPSADPDKGSHPMGDHHNHNRNHNHHHNSNRQIDGPAQDGPQTMFPEQQLPTEDERRDHQRMEGEEAMPAEASRHGSHDHHRDGQTSDNTSPGQLSTFSRAMIVVAALVCTAILICLSTLVYSAVKRARAYDAVPETQDHHYGSLTGGGGSKTRA